MLTTLTIHYDSSLNQTFCLIFIAGPLLKTSPGLTMSKWKYPARHTKFSGLFFDHQVKKVVDLGLIPRHDCQQIQPQICPCSFMKHSIYLASIS